MPIKAGKPDIEKFIGGAPVKEKEQPKARAGRGRPTKEEAAQDILMGVYVTADERETINAWMKRRRISFSAWVKGKLVDEDII